MQRTPALAELRSQYDCENMPACSRCAFRYWCAGDCRAEALATGGVPDAPSPYCQELQRIIPEMFWMIAAGWNTLGGAEDQARLSAGRC